MRTLKYLAVSVAMAGLAPAALAQETQREVRVIEHPHVVPGTILSVAAQGVARGTPDMANISMGVVTDGDTAAAALQQNARQMNALISAVRRAGVAERDIQTANVSVRPRYVYHDNETPRIAGYQAQNTVNVRVRDVDNLGRVIDAAVNAGGNNVNGVSFSYQDPDAQLDVARRDAMAEARRMAELYAAAIGAEIFRVVSISEGGGFTPPRPEMIVVTGMRASMDSAPTPTAPGELETNVTVNVVYELR